jgi:DNA gyrase subunit B
MLRNGQYTEAKDLKIGDSLMPLYKRVEPIDKKRSVLKTYEQVYNPGSNEWLFTHKIVVPCCRKWEGRHHIDSNRFNNSPENIRVMKWNEHVKLHRQNVLHQYSQVLGR